MNFNYININMDTSKHINLNFCSLLISEYIWEMYILGKIRENII